MLPTIWMYPRDSPNPQYVKHEMLHMHCRDNYNPRKYNYQKIFAHESMTKDNIRKILNN